MLHAIMFSLLLILDATLLFKQRFKAALKGAMQKQRQLGKTVALLGDFDLHY
jgi:hypothetical protein